MDIPEDYERSPINHFTLLDKGTDSILSISVVAILGEGTLSGSGKTP